MSDQLERVKKHLKDRRWRLNNLYFITDKKGKKVRFKLNWAQEQFMNECHNLNIILKARQLGFTTLACILALDFTLFNSNFRAGIIAHGRDEANKIFREKVKYAYDCLPEFLKKIRTATTDRAGELVFNNNSSIRVSTSFRGGTLQFLHISEFGKICAKYPDKAKEIVTGALNALDTGQTVCIESTAEGRSGYFFDYCEKARSLKRKGIQLTAMDYKFFFFTWWKHPEYKLENAEHVEITQEQQTYFRELEQMEKVKLSHAQKVWYLKKQEDNEEDMLKEYPSTPKEAFSKSIEGAYFSKQIEKLEADGRYTLVPHEVLLPVHTAWDLGMDDSTAIWFFQYERSGAYRMIDYYENSGEGLPHYAKVLNDRGYEYGRHIAPHDIKVREIGSGKSRLSIAKELGISFEIAPGGHEIGLADGIEAVRTILSKCYFNSIKTKEGFKALKEFRKAWDDKAGCYKNSPVHDWTSHGTDAFRMMAIGFVPRSTRTSQGRVTNKYRKER